MGRLYFILFVAVACFGWLASNLTAGPAGAGKKAGESRRLMVAETGAYPATGNEYLVLDREDDGHFYAEVEINGRPIVMMVDTGASGVALTEADARTAGIATSIGMNRHIGEGAGGAVYGDVVQIDRIRLGDTEVRDLEGVVLSGGQTSLLGQDFLRRYRSVEIADDRMILR